MPSPKKIPKPDTMKDIFKTLRAINVLPFAEAKGNANLLYLPWANAHEIMMEHYPDYEWKWFLSENDEPYYITDTGYFVCTYVIVNGVEKSEILPVTDYNNKVLTNPNAFDINTAIRRCYVKTLAQFGLGLQLYVKGDPNEVMPPLNVRKKIATKPKKTVKRAVPKSTSPGPMTADQLNELRELCKNKLVPEENVVHVTHGVKSGKFDTITAAQQIKLLKETITKAESGQKDA